MKNKFVLSSLFALLIFNYNLNSKVTYFWERIFSETSIMSSPCSVPAGVKCIDSNNCIIALNCGGAYLKILKSTNQGKNWTIISQDSSKSLINSQVMAYPSNNYIYLGATRTGWIENNYFIHAIIWRTYDGGKTFDETILEGAAYVRSMSMSDSMNGMATTDPPYKIYITNDGWRTYKMLEHPWYSVGLGAPGKYCHFIDSLNFLVYFYVRRDGYRITGIARTTDGGVSWYEFLLPYNDWIDCFNFENRNLGWAVGGRSNGIGNQSSDIIYKTTDGGFTWEKIYDKESEPVFGLQNIASRDSLYKIAVGQFGKVLKTTNGGQSWEWVFAKHVDNSPVLHVTFAGRIALIGSYALGLWRMWEYEKVSSNDEDINNKTKIVLYPNPATDCLKIRFNEYLDSPVELEIYNSIGKRVTQFSFDYIIDEINIKLPELPDGVYYYRIKTGKELINGNFIIINQ
jgi:photosystem II stability/assembly factor-like uncharacterized protein